MIRTSSNMVLTSILLLAGCGVSSSSPEEDSNQVTAKAASPLGSTGAAQRPAVGARFESASLSVAAGSECILRHPATAAQPGDLRLTADDDGVLRFHAARPQKPGDLDMLALDCVDSAGVAKTYPVDLSAAETFAPRPFDGRKAGLKLRPGLEGDPTRFSTEELIAKGYGLRPDSVAKAAISRRTSGLGGPSTVDSMDPYWL